MKEGCEPAVEVPRVAVARVEASRNLNHVTGACVVAGVALMQQNVAVGSLVILASVLLRVVVGKAMEGKRPATRARGQSRPQSPEKTEKKEEKGQTYEYDWSGTVTPKSLKAGAGTPQFLGGPQDQSRVGKVENPGIRAIRGVGSSHGNEESQPRQGSAISRGRAAMTMHDRQHPPGQEARDTKPRDSSSELEEIPADFCIRAADESDELAKKFEKLDIQSGRENLRGDWKVSGSTSSGSAVAAESSEVQSTRPWEIRRFQTIPRASKDQWDLSLWSQGWLVRAHHKSRVMYYQPIHSTTPVDCGTLAPERVTVKIQPVHQIIEDQWTQPTRARSEQAWMGYTFFRVR